MVSKTTVVCWIFGVFGIIWFLASLSLPMILAAQNMIAALMFVLGSMYFNIKYKELASRKIDIKT